MTASCPDKEEPTFCWSGANVPQKYCASVNLQTKWRCRKSSYGWCACKSPSFRRNDGKCVSEDQCERNPQTRDKPVTSDPYVPEIPENLQLSPEYRGNVLKFIQSNESIHVLESSQEHWRNNTCQCLGSTFTGLSDKGAHRTVDCYMWAPLIDGTSPKEKTGSVESSKYPSPQHLKCLPVID